MFQGLGRTDDGYAIFALCTGIIRELDEHYKPRFRKFYSCVAIDPCDYKFFTENYQPEQSSHFEMYGEELMTEYLDDPDAEPPMAMINHLLQKYQVDFSVSQDYLNKFCGFASLSSYFVHHASGRGQAGLCH